MQTILAGLLLLQASPALAQSGYTLLVQHNGAEVGREQITLEQGRRRGLSGTTLTISAKYPAARPSTQIGARLERSPDGQLAVFQLDLDRPDGPLSILAAGAGARIVLKTIAKGSDAAQEVPGGPDVVLLDDNVVGLFAAVADLAKPGGTHLTAIYPRTSRRVSLTATRDGARILLTGGLSGTLGVDGSGRLVSVALPGSGITASVGE